MFETLPYGSLPLAIDWFPLSYALTRKCRVSLSSVSHASRSVQPQEEVVEGSNPQVAGEKHR